MITFQFGEETICFHWGKNGGFWKLIKSSSISLIRMREALIEDAIVNSIHNDYA